MLMYMGRKQRTLIVNRQGLTKVLRYSTKPDARAGIRVTLVRSAERGFQQASRITLPEPYCGNNSYGDGFTRHFIGFASCTKLLAGAV
jgi:hypothetical protein